MLHNGLFKERYKVLRNDHVAIDLSVGMMLLKKTGDPVQKGEPLMEIHYNNENKLETALELIRKAYAIGLADPGRKKVILMRPEDFV